MDVAALSAARAAGVKFRRRSRRRSVAVALARGFSSLQLVRHRVGGEQPPHGRLERGLRGRPAARKRPELSR